jgi:squalene cyclase
MSEIGCNVLLVQFIYQKAVPQPTFRNIDCSVSNRYTSNVLSATEQEGKMITNCECRIYMHGVRKAVRPVITHSTPFTKT